jgi:hypothetical protein
MKNKYYNILIFTFVVNLTILVLGYFNTIFIEDEPYLIREEERMILKNLKSFEMKEKEFFILFNKIRTRDGLEGYDSVKEFYTKLQQFPPEPKDKLQQALNELFIEAYSEADKSIQRIYIYRKTGEPIALIYSNLFEDKFIDKRSELLRSISRTRDLLKQHIKDRKHAKEK